MARHDYRALGFRCGLEIHQQLDTGKLFCRCASAVVDVEEVPKRTVFTLQRRLRPTESELGELDPAAAAEARRGLTFTYHGIDGHSCLVEADEEPPHGPDPAALDVTLTFAALAGARPVAEVQFMRKIVIDGSNTSGFQRTGLVALGGRVGDVGIWTIAVEEDSCRKLDTDDGKVHYTLDRLGIPLIEIATAPDIRDAEHAKETAARLGALLRATGRVRRGLGTIRQDLNVSIAGGDRVEIKGVQDLRAVPRVIDREIDRQKHLIHIREQLKRRGAKEAALAGLKTVDVSKVLARSESKVVRTALDAQGAVLALPLPGFAGLIKGATPESPRLGQEFAAYAQRDAGVRGVFHSDELPAYGITAEETQAAHDALHLGPQDAFVLSAAPRDTAEKALRSVRERAVLALRGVPREVRNARPDDTTTYLRPLPGAARMYPETDTPPFLVTPELWQRIQAELPERPEESAERLVRAHALSQEVSQQIVAEGHLATFDAVVATVDRPGELSRLLLQTLPELAAENVPVERLEPAHLTAILAALDAGRFAKEALGTVTRAYADAPQGGIEGAIAAAGASAVDEREVQEVIARIVESRADFVKQRGLDAVGPLMGLAMKELRGKADGALISKVLTDEIKKRSG